MIRGLLTSRRRKGMSIMRRKGPSLFDADGFLSRCGGARPHEFEERPSTYPALDEVLRRNVFAAENLEALISTTGWSAVTTRAGVRTLGA